MTRTWEPGDVAMVTPRLRAGSPQVMLRRRDERWHEPSGFLTDDHVHEVRPLVVIDPESEDDATWFVHILARWGYKFSGTPDGFDPARDGSCIKAALREFAYPKPPACTDEPKDLAARIVDRDGDIWARSGNRWGCLTTQSAPQDWQDLINVCGPLHEVTP